MKITRSTLRGLIAEEHARLLAETKMGHHEEEEEEEEDDSFMDVAVGDDDVAYGAADVALRQGRGHRTDEGDDLYEGDSQGDDDTPGEGDADYEHAYSMGGGDDAAGFAADYDTGSRSRFPSGRGSINEARWVKLAGILKG